MAVEYKLRGDASGLKRELQSVAAKEARLEQQTIKTKKGFDRLNTSVLTNEKSLGRANLQTNRMRRSTTGLAAAVGALRNQILLVTFATAGLIVVTKRFIDSASAANEAQNLVTQTFGDSAVEIELFASKAAGAIGQTRGEALKLLGDLGSIAKGFGFTAAAAANFSQTALQLASDIGSLKFASTEEVLRAFRSAIVGQSEPMLRFGTDVRVVALEQVALEEGIINTKRALTNQEKAVAALAQVYRTNQDAISDFAETQGEFATASKITGAKLREIVEVLGTKMLPAAAKAAVGITLLIDNFDLVRDAAKEATVEFLIMQTGPVRFGLINPEQAKDAANKVKEIFGDLVNFFKRVSGFGQANAPGNLFDQMFGSDREVIKQREARVGSSLDELLKKFKDAQTKFESAFDIGEGVEQAILNLGDGMRDVGDGLEESVLPPMMDMSNAMSDIAIDAEKFRIQMETTRLTRLPRGLNQTTKAMKDAVRLGQTFTNTLAQAALHGSSLKQTFLSIASSFLSFGIGKFFSSAQFGGIPGFAHGTSFAPGGPAVVGERGPEIVNLPRGAQVIPNNRTTNNVTFGNINITNTGGNLDAESVSRAFNEAVDLGLPVRRGV